MGNIQEDNAYLSTYFLRFIIVPQGGRKEGKERKEGKKGRKKGRKEKEGRKRKKGRKEGRKKGRKKERKISALSTRPLKPSYDTYEDFTCAFY